MSSDSQKHGLLALTIGALGIVFGDIGTSPLYALRECFGHEYGLHVTPENIIGILSLIFWTMFFIISIKYMAYVMRADNKGEGGILSLMALAVTGRNQEGKNRRRTILIALGLFGAALLYGDGVITPAITVLGAIEGLIYLTPVFEGYVIPITLAALTCLFLVQRYGTGKIGFFFGPIMLLWFVTIGALGVGGILENPQVLAAFNPVYAVEFFINNELKALLVLGSVFLVVTGGEALYADMGHFGRIPIRWAWFAISFPALILNYFGQGALLLNNPSAISNPFYLLAPKWFLAPLVLLSTAAAIIASQALISGVFSLSRQAVQLGFCPRISIIHTSSREIGQIYIPSINWALFVGVVWLVVTFRNSSNLAAAYGIAVTATMVITTILAYEVAIRFWKWSVFKASLIFGTFLIMDLAFFGANAIKVTHGGWVPLAIGALFFLLMTTWQRGRQILSASLKARSVSMQEFAQRLVKQPPLRIPGTAVYMAGDPWGVPVPLLHNLKHNKVLHERVAILTIKTKDQPTVPRQERVTIEEVIPNFYRIIAYYGFMETPKMKHILEACRQNEIYFNVSETTFVLGRETILASNHPGMALWREKLFSVMSKNAQRPTAFFRIPPNQVIEVGIQVEI